MVVYVERCDDGAVDQDFLVAVYGLCVWVCPRYNLPYDGRCHYDQRFPSKCKLLATFHSTYGDHDDGPVRIGSIGWDEMIQNVVMLELVYTPDNTPAKQSGCRMFIPA